MCCSIHSCRLVSLFNLVCWIATIILVSYWIYEYTLDDDLCIVDYQKYYETDSDKFPLLTICLKNQISKQKLKLHNPEIDVDTYINFLSGKIFDKELAKIDYDNVTIDFTRYVNESSILWRNGTWGIPGTVLRASYSFIKQRTAMDGLYQCYELQTPKSKDFEAMFFYIDGNGIPPRNRPQNYEMLTYLHYPNHFLSSEKNIKYTWPIRCLLYTSPSPRDGLLSRMPSSA